jgi:exosome complex component CSL4
MADPQIVLPGDSLGPSSTYISGSGTHIASSQLSASLTGVVVQSRPPSSTSKSKTKTALSVQHHLPSTATTSILPEVDSIVLARVSRITKNMANVGILVVGEQVVGEEWAGVIRVQDVRATEKDKVRVQDSFRVGDVVRAVVVSILFR